MAKTITLPGLVDPHVHFRDPGQTHKEDFYTGTSAALAGGYVAVLDMPNNVEPITTLERLEAKITSAQKQTVADIGFNFGTLGDNFDEFAKVIDKVTGLKIYMNVTTGNFKINATSLTEIYMAWPGTKPILLHAEDDVSEIVFKTLAAVPKQTHICHVSSEAELTFVMKAKEKGLPISCGVTPHHLFMTNKDADRLGAYGHMKPYLKSARDVKFLWDHLDAIDIIESDHAPHTREEKDSAEPPFGVPGIETTLPLMLTAQQEGKLNQKRLVELLSSTPARLFNITIATDSKVEVELGDFEISNDRLLTRVGWSPFAGRHVAGRVLSTHLRGAKVYENGQILVKPGSGRILS